MILAFDSYYFDGKAKTVCLEFEGWADIDNFNVYTEVLEHVAEYVPGEFYKRELPCILSLLGKINTENVSAIIVDGYVFLDDDGKLGLGGHLYEAITHRWPVIGVAKSNFATVDKLKMPVYRGVSSNPLFISSIGMDAEIAAAHIKSMSGKFRMPTLLKKLDQLTKQV
ncbi:endonuclease V [Mucilaginibacter sp.]|uniref:endonuclease V n=1 Tax=Mucilaginibacter sp. TaxID=1882438 RepID=UPI0025F8537D|nr:endonuclease V [Mucilaginibacter sp.]